MILRFTLFVVYRFVFLLLLFTSLRFLFYLFNADYFQTIPWEKVQDAYVLGLRFDASIIMTFNVIPLVFFIWGKFIFRSTFLLQIARFLFWIGNSVIVGLNILDLEYFSFTGKRTGIELLGLQQDIADQTQQLILHYWDLLLLWFVYSLLILRHTLAIRSTVETVPHVYRKAVIFSLFFIGVAVLTIRGGLQLKPLRPNIAFTIEPNKLGHLALNTPFNFFMTIGIEPIQEVHHFKEDRDVRKLLEYLRQPKDTFFQPLPSSTNVVLLILESFASEYCGIANAGKGYTPFLDSLAQVGLYFPHHFANGRVSMEAVPSILGGIPGCMQEPYITSLYQTNHLVGLGNILRDKGYTTAFFHAAKNGSMGFDAFTKNAGFSNYYGLNEYPNKDRDYDGTWGIYDGPYLQYADSILSNLPKPFAACIFTLSSHQPYAIPIHLENKYVPGSLKIHRSISYVDDMVRQFFKSAQQQPWFKNTLFVLTADHTHEHANPLYMNSKGDYLVPLLFYHPNRVLKADTARLVQHVDIMPSILDVMGIKSTEVPLFGQSVFRKKIDLAIEYTNQQYRLYRKEEYIEGNVGMPIVIKNYQDQKIREATEEEKNLLMAFIQYHNNGMIHNNLYQFGR